jgi:hypothetical protein
MPQDDVTATTTAPDGAPSGIETRPKWRRPEITSFKPVSDARGISYRIGDGISNLS